MGSPALPAPAAARLEDFPPTVRFVDIGKRAAGERETQGIVRVGEWGIGKLTCVSGY